MAIAIKGLSGLQRGIELAAVGVDLESHEVRYYPAVNEKKNGYAGEPNARAFSDKFSRDISISGEVTGATGLMAVVMATAITTAITNDVSDFGDGTGGIYLDEATVTQGRDGWRSVAFKMSSDPGIA